MNRKSFLFLVRTPPSPALPLEAALAAAAFHQDVQVVLMADGVFHLVGRAASCLDAALAEAEIETLAVYGPSLIERGLSHQSGDAPLDAAGLARLLEAAQIVVTL